MEEVYFNSEVVEIRDMVRRFAQEQIAPLAIECDAEDRFPVELVQPLFEAGVLTMPMSEEYGGIDASTQTLSVVLEEVGAAFATMGPVLLSTFSPIKIVAMAGQPHQQKAIFSQMSAKPSLGAFCLSEPHFGSDARSMKTSLVRKGDRYLLNGTKRWITNGGVADWYLLFTRSGEGRDDYAVCMIPATSKGISFGKKEQKMGLRGGPMCDVIFEDVEVPEEYLVGKPGEGWHTLDRVANTMRCWGAASISIGIARSAFEIAARYAAERQAFGKSIGKFQGVGFKLADMAAHLRSTQLLIRDTNHRVDQELPSVSANTMAQVSMSKYRASDTAMSVATEAVQILGGYGYMREYQVERMMRDAKAFQILDGSNEIQRLILSRDILREFA